MKVCIDELVKYSYNGFETYFNVDTYKCAFGRENEDKWIRIPECTEAEVAYAYATKKVNNEGDYRFKKILKSNNIEDECHWLVEDLNLFEEWLDFCDQYMANIIIKWCEEKGFDYTLEPVKQDVLEEFDKRNESYIKMKFEEYLRGSKRKQWSEIEV